MKFLILFSVMLSLVSCEGSKSSSKKSAAKSAVIEDVLNRVLHFYEQDDSETINKLEFFDNDTVKVTKLDGSSETLKQENIDEGDEDDEDLMLENICSGESSGTTSFVDMRLTKASDNSFSANMGSEVW